MNATTADTQLELAWQPATAQATQRAATTVTEGPAPN